jgi:hypothetical protein
MKVEKIKNPLLFWLPTGTCCRNLVNSKIHLFMDLFLESAFSLESDFRDIPHCPLEEKKTQKKEKRHCTKSKHAKIDRKSNQLKF